MAQDDLGKFYGRWAVNEDGSPRPVQPVDRILGARAIYDKRGRPEWVEIQWIEGAAVSQFQLDFPNAMFLLSCLKDIQLDTGLPFPDDPRHPSAR